MFAVRTILCPIDFSRRSEYAFCVACALARDHQARLVLAHIQPPPVVVDEVGVIPDCYSHPEALREKLAQYHPEVAAERAVVEGDPATEIVQLAADHRADLIVMGTHGRTGVRRLLLGSVAETVLRKATCPVLTIKAPALDAAPASQEQDAVAVRR